MTRRRDQVPNPHGRPFEHKYQLIHLAAVRAGAKAPRCTASIARKYRRAEALKDADILRVNLGSQRGAEILQAVCTRLRPCPPKGNHAPFVVVDRYLADAAHRWIRSTCQSMDSVAVYLTAFALWCRFKPNAAPPRTTLHRQLETTGRDILALLEEMRDAGYAPRSICVYRDALRSWFHWLWDRHLIDRAPFTREAIRSYRVDPLRVEKGTGARQALSQAEGSALATWCTRNARPHVGLSVMLQCVAGLRSQEVAQLDRRQISELEDGSVGLVIRGKGKKTRDIILEPVVVRAWIRYRDSRHLRGKRGPLIRKPAGGHYSRKTVQNWAKKALQGIGRPDLSSHDLRRTSGTLLRENGADIDQVATHLGHKNPTLTRDTYIARRLRMRATTGIGARTEGDATP